MTHFDCFMVAAWMFAIGWFLGAIYAQNQSERTENPRATEVSEPSPNCEAWGLPAVA